MDGETKQLLRVIARSLALIAAVKAAKAVANTAANADSPQVTALAQAIDDLNVMERQK